jgi:membrane-bound serine protease (ClpP class)
MLFGVSGILFEFTYPGLFLPGIVGGLSFVTACYLFQPLPLDKTTWPMLISVGFAVMLLLGFIFKKSLSALKVPVVTGLEGLIRQKGIAKSDLDPKGTVLIHGELWNAVSDEPVSANDSVVVSEVDGMILKVKKFQ